jgi:hypothetical protein
MAEDAARRLRVVEETEVGLVEGINFPAQKEEGASDTGEQQRFPRPR